MPSSIPGPVAIPGTRAECSNCFPQPSFQDIFNSDNTFRGSNRSFGTSQGQVFFIGDGSTGNSLFFNIPFAGNVGSVIANSAATPIRVSLYAPSYTSNPLQPTYDFTSPTLTYTNVNGSTPSNTTMYVGTTSTVAGSISVINGALVFSLPNLTWTGGNAGLQDEAWVKLEYTTDTNGTFAALVGMTFRTNPCAYGKVNVQRLLNNAFAFVCNFDLCNASTQPALTITFANGTSNVVGQWDANGIFRVLDTEFANILVSAKRSVAGTGLCGNCTSGTSFLISAYLPGGLPAGATLYYLQGSTYVPLQYLQRICNYSWTLVASGATGTRTYTVSVINVTPSGPLSAANVNALVAGTTASGSGATDADAITALVAALNALNISAGGTWSSSGLVLTVRSGFTFGQLTYTYTGASGNTNVQPTQAC